MLGGIDPLLVIILKSKPAQDIAGPPVSASSTLAGFADRLGVPIPFYLSEKPIGVVGALAPGGALSRQLAQAGIFIESETNSIDIQTKVEAIVDKDTLGNNKDPIVTQQALDSQVNINLVASKNSIVVTALIAIMQTLIPRLVSREYSIHYINGPTVLFGGLLHHFGTSVNPNDDLIRIEMTLSTAAKESPTPKVAAQIIPNTSGPTPLG